MPHKRFVEPHDLRGICIACNITLSILSQRTGIPEDELVQFAAGKHALCARDRFAILEELAEWATPSPPRVYSPMASFFARAGYEQLMREVKDEEREQDEELDQVE